MRNSYRLLLILIIPVLLLAQPKTPPSFYDVQPQHAISLNSAGIDPAYKRRYVLGSTGIFILGAIASAGFLYIMPASFTNWHKNDFNDFNLLGRRWVKNVSRSPVVDPDGFFLNWVTHPYWGAVYYMQPRVAGYDWTESALYSMFASTFFWEYGIEGFAEVPSWQDLIITPVVGSAVGELFYQLTLHIQANHNQVFGSPFLGMLSLALMDPLRILMQSPYASQYLGIKRQHETTSFLMPDKRGVKFVILHQF